MSVRTGLKKLGDAHGKNESDFLAALGPPRAAKTLGTGRILVEWQSGWFPTQMIAVLFDRSHEFVKLVACYPRTLAATEDAEPATDAPSPRMQGRLAGADLGATRWTSSHAGRRQGLWARSPR